MVQIYCASDVLFISPKQCYTNNVTVHVHDFYMCGMCSITGANSHSHKKDDENMKYKNITGVPGGPVSPLFPVGPGKPCV